MVIDLENSPKSFHSRSSSVLWLRVYLQWFKIVQSAANPFKGNCKSQYFQKLDKEVDVGKNPFTITTLILLTYFFLFTSRSLLILLILLSLNKSFIVLWMFIAKYIHTYKHLLNFTCLIWNSTTAIILLHFIWSLSTVLWKLKKPKKNSNQ